MQIPIDRVRLMPDDDNPSHNTLLALNGDLVFAFEVGDDALPESIFPTRHYALDVDFHDPTEKDKAMTGSDGTVFRFVGTVLSIMPEQLQDGTPFVGVHLTQGGQNAVASLSLPPDKAVGVSYGQGVSVRLAPA